MKLVESGDGCGILRCACHWSRWRITFLFVEWVIKVVLCLSCVHGAVSA